MEESKVNGAEIKESYSGVGKGPYLIIQMGSGFLNQIRFPADPLSLGQTIYGIFSFITIISDEFRN